MLNLLTLEAYLTSKGLVTVSSYMIETGLLSLNHGMRNGIRSQLVGLFMKLTIREQRCETSSLNPFTLFANNRSLNAAMLVCLAFATGCSGGNSSGSDSGNPAAVAPFQELYDQGIDRYLGKYSPMLAETEGNVVTHTFGAGDGPLCIYGAEYRMATRDTGSSDLMIFLRGGGYCASDSCSLAFPEGERGIPKLGVLDPARPGNPVASWSTVYVPYCDGGWHISDSDNDSDGDGQPDRYQRGLHNLSAALDVAVASFPSPSRILLAGGGSGGLGASFALPLVRKLYPDVPIELVNDSGVGLLTLNDPQYFTAGLEEWNADAFFPASCTTCIDADGHMTDYHKWELGQDPNFRLGMMSFKQDWHMVLAYGGGAEQFEQALVAEMAELESAYPERVRSFLTDGTDHVILLDGLATKNALDVTAGDISAIDWVTAMLDGSSEWVSASDP